MGRYLDRYRTRRLRSGPSIASPPITDTARFAWSESRTRQDRYAVLEAFADHTIYQGPHGPQIRREFGAYKFIRPIFNPCARIIDFHESYIWPGRLDPAAGPGVDPETGQGISSALPILPAAGTDELAIRRAIASVWKASNWPSRKGLVPRWGATLGDVGIEAIEDEDRGLIRIRIVHPGMIAKKIEDPFGNVKEVRYERWEADPLPGMNDQPVLYIEEITNEGNGEVIHRTYRGDRTRPFEWPGTPGRVWRSRFSFIPLALIRHIDRGGDWGDSELARALFKTVERDSQGSNISDKIQAAVNRPGLLTAGTPFNLPRDNRGKPQIELEITEREGIPFLTLNAPDARWIPLDVPLPLDAASQHGRSISDSLEADYPELLADPVGLAASGEARREARRKAADKVVARRVAYDDALVRILKMAMTMGGVLGFEDFAGFDEQSFAAKKLEFGIGQRAVFAPDPIEVIAEKQAIANLEQTRAETFSALITAGFPLDLATERAYPQEAETVERMRAVMQARVARAPVVDDEAVVDEGL